MTQSVDLQTQVETWQADLATERQRLVQAEAVVREANARILMLEGGLRFYQISQGEPAQTEETQEVSTEEGGE